MYGSTTAGYHLEEVVFKEIPHGFVSGDVPPGVEVDVQDEEPEVNVVNLFIFVATTLDK